MGKQVSFAGRSVLVSLLFCVYTGGHARERNEATEIGLICKQDIMRLGRALRLNVNERYAGTGMSHEEMSLFIAQDAARRALGEDGVNVRDMWAYIGVKAALVTETWPQAQRKRIEVDYYEKARKSCRSR